MAKFSKFLICRQNSNSHAWQQLKNFIDSCCCNSHHVGHGKNDDETRKFPIRKRVKCLGEISSERERERKMHKYATCNLTEYLLEFVFTFQQIESLIMQKLYIESWNIASMVHNYEKYRMGKVLENCSLCIKSIYYL